MLKMGTINKELFEELKQRCVDCVNEPNDGSIELLKQFVIKSDEQFINALYQYTIFPLRLIIANLPKKQTNCEKLLESSVDCLSIILQKSTVNRFDIFSDIFANLFHLIDANSHNNNDESFVLNLNEDLLLSVIKCSKSLIQSCDKTISNQLISEQFRPQFGHSIHILLNIALNERYVLLKVEAIDTIICLVNKCLNIESQDCLQTESEDLIAYFLPGISINISKLILSDDKLNRKVINSCLTLLSNIIVSTFKTISSDPQNESIDRQRLEEDLKNKFIVIRDAKWLENTCDKLLIILKNIISSLISNQNLSVRQSLTLFVLEILSNCSPLFINKCFSVLIQIPLTYLNDDCEQIRLECDSFISKFSKTYVNSESSKTCLDLIEDEIYLYITRLPRLIRTANENEKQSFIYLLYGYLKCLGTDGINDLLYSPQHKERLFQCFIDICEFDFHNIHLLEQVTTCDQICYLNERQHILSDKWVKKNFSFLRDEKAVIALTKCCQLIGNSGESQLLIDYLIDSLRQSKLSPSIIFVSNLIISNINGNYKDIEEFIQVYLSNITASQEELTIEHMNKNVLRQCLLVEGLAAFVKLYDSDSSHNYLLKCLFPLLETAGSLNLNIFQSSYMALKIVASHFGFNCISELITLNMDYLMNSICINLKHFLNNQNVMIVIKVMLKYSNKDMLHYYVDAIEQIICVIDCYYHSEALPLMQVLYSYVSTVSYCYLNDFELKNEEKSDEQNNYETKAKHVVMALEQFISNIHVSHHLENDNQINSDEEKEENADQIVKQVPYYVTLIEKILDRCVHLMSSSDSKLKLIVLDIVIKSLFILKPFEDNLLPMAHKLWPPLVDRFQDKDVIVIKRAFSCLLIMSQMCGDFIRMRTVKEVLPKILSFLKSHSELSYKKDKASAYRFTIAYQFQLDILNSIALIAVNLDLRDKDLWQLIVEIMPYLNALQPLPLQESAIVALKKIADLDLNSVYYYLKMTYSSTNELKSEYKNFPIIRFGDKEKEYMKNITKLLNDLSLI